jgi:predicted enzyme related to lactoylglutathione lyase
MDLVSIRIITDDVDRLVAFYELVTGHAAVRYTPAFAELATPTCTLAIGHSDTVQLFGAGSATAAANRSVIIEFKVADVDAEYTRLHAVIIDWVQAPTTMPWGNRSILLRDPDGNLVNLFTPVTEEAVAKFA